ncbi:MAG: DKNYY domain-containing protein [Candidatus Azobacteroides sp.]|nr:DKNYY domain-containing protein [Candidatus Azobacteroides sp.]
MNLLTFLVIGFTCGQQSLSFSGTLPNIYRPFGIKESPAFSVQSYAFYPDQELIGVYKYWIPPMSGSGIGSYYIDTLQGCDYHSFEFIDVGKEICKDKNTIYFRDKDLGISPEGARLIVPDEKKGIYSFRIIKDNMIYLYKSSYWENERIEYRTDEIISEILFRRNDSLFVYYEDEYIGFPEEFDTESFMHVDGSLYQDKKNLYRLYGLRENPEIKCIKDEQITGKHFFTAYEEEKRKGEESKNYLLIGSKSLYKDDQKLSVFEMESYYFPEDSHYFLYNGYLYHYQTQMSFLSYPVGVSSGSSLPFDEFYPAQEESHKVPRRDYTKIKLLWKNALLYDNSELFFEEDPIQYPSEMDISKLEYIGQFPYRLYITLISDKDSSCENSGPVFRYENELYIICNHELAKLRKIESERNKEYKNVDFKNLRFLNEYYFTDGKLLYCNQEIKDILRNTTPHNASKKVEKLYFNAKALNLKNIKVIGRYFTDGKKLYYNYIRITHFPEELKSDLFQPLNDPYSSVSLSRKNDIWNGKPIDLKVTGIDFENLRLIPTTEYLTDGIYLFYKYHLLETTIDVNTLRVLDKDFLEDAEHYFYQGLVIEKNKLGIRLVR